MWIVVNNHCINKKWWRNKQVKLYASFQTFLAPRSWSLLWTFMVRTIWILPYKPKVCTISEYGYSNIAFCDDKSWSHTFLHQNACLYYGIDATMTGIKQPFYSQIKGSLLYESFCTISRHNDSSTTKACTKFHCTRWVYAQLSTYLPSIYYLSPIYLSILYMSIINLYYVYMCVYMHLSIYISIYII